MINISYGLNINNTAKFQHKYKLRKQTEPGVDQTHSQNLTQCQ